ncbi:glycosyltransferase family 2 protein [Mucilaginibacter arboris]|uniref:Glycosyltransferase n=1 Tax=Mucilaginibacter arboris TaxID=2682090 RepID=A0A7K1SX55_9SPHI|nr:glycosyltransferase family 2 protein [Mucilaginibacter arboris]MVN21911.1 glycosyltransferase [Mucilaginibacter arboris]
MHLFKLPSWINPHLYKEKKFADLNKAELFDLKSRIKKFSAEKPDVSVVIPAWNEENNIFRALSSIAANHTSFKVEIIVINNNSTDGTQNVLEELGIRNYFQQKQGTPYARQMGLDKARGKYHLCADCDTFYPPNWIDLMVKPMAEDKSITGVYGRYSFLPPEGKNRLDLFFYELVTGLLVRIRRKNREYLNMLGFNMGFITEAGRNPNGFNVEKSRKFDNANGSDYFVEEAEDGRMAQHLKTKGRLKLVTHAKARVFTSPRRLLYDGGIFKAFKNRFKLHLKALSEYLTGKSKPSVV